MSPCRFAFFCGQTTYGPDHRYNIKYMEDAVITETNGDLSFSSHAIPSYDCSNGGGGCLPPTLSYKANVTLTGPSGSGSMNGPVNVGCCTQINPGVVLAATPGTYTGTVTYYLAEGFNMNPPAWGVPVTKNIGIGWSGANYKSDYAGQASVCTYRLDCDTTPTCPNNANYRVITLINDPSTICDNYWVQQFISSIVDNVRTCYKAPNVWPFQSGRNSGRAWCT
jgi:hypothetical protein